MKTLSLIYSQPSLSAIEEMVDNFIYAFSEDKDMTINDIFYYGVFCATSTYANYHWECMATECRFDVPVIFLNACATPRDRENYVNTTIEEVMKGEIVKPEWMTFIEMELSVDEYDNQPPTFLRLIPKDEKYRHLGESIIDFLYSPNRVMVVY